MRGIRIEVALRVWHDKHATAGRRRHLLAIRRGMALDSRGVDPVEIRHGTLQGIADELRREEAQPFQFEPKRRRRDAQLLLRRF